MLSFVNSFMSWYLKRRIPVMEETFKFPAETQEAVFKSLIKQAAKTSFGRDYGLKDINTIDDYRNRVPLHHYDDIKPYINRIIHGEQSVLWSGEINWFAKSSGTTADKSKFIPVSYDALEDCQFRGSRDVIAWYYYHKPNAKVFQGKGLIIGGSHQVNELADNSYYGDLSAVMMNNLPFIANQLSTPPMDIALLDDWELKLKRIVDTTVNQNVTNISGVPSWTLLVMQALLEKANAKHIEEIWPNLELYIHGGVNFEPYRSQFSQLISNPEMGYRETYNASEGFFGIQDMANEDMVLMLDYGIFYEFVPLNELNKDNPKTLWIDEVELNTNYALVLNTNAGLWRYIIGDTIMFTSKNPYRFKITGRTKSFINAFGEELMVENAETAISKVQEKFSCVVSEFTAAPVYLSRNEKGRHQWAIEFSKNPNDLNEFAKGLDEELKKVNSDYEAKRQKDIALLEPEIITCREGTFYEWFKSKQKLGGQHKMPKLCNNRDIIEQIIKINDQ